jgi:hypothetical protein
MPCFGTRASAAILRRRPLQGKHDRLPAGLHL